MLPTEYLCKECEDEFQKYWKELPERFKDFDRLLQEWKKKEGDLYDKLRMYVLFDRWLRDYWSKNYETFP